MFVMKMVDKYFKQEPDHSLGFQCEGTDSNSLVLKDHFVKFISKLFSY